VRFPYRYKPGILIEKLIEELEWLKIFQGILLAEATKQQGKLSGYLLEELNINHLKAIIEQLEIEKEKLKMN
jgi:hypothetical protein